MDTVEQLKGTYFLDGMMNLSAGDLAFWSVVDEAKKQLGVEDVLALALIIGGIPFIPTRAKLDARRAIPNTSPISVAMRTMIKYRLSSQWRSPTWKTMLNGDWAKTNNLGGLIGRWISWLGVLITAYDVITITRKSIWRYNLIVKPEHRV